MSILNVITGSILNVMGIILKFYSAHINVINFIKDIVYLGGAGIFVKYLWSWNYTRKTELIDYNLKFRERVELSLSKYIINKYKNGIKDIGVRFIFWKNYPFSYKEEDDAFKHLFRIEYNEDIRIEPSWMDSSGVFFEELFTTNSIYIANEGEKFFFAPSKQIYYGYTEYSDVVLIRHLPFTNIVNFDFREFIEYEPVFYTKYKYHNYKKLYSSRYIVRENLGKEFLYLELDSKNWCKYNMHLKMRILILKYVDSLLSKFN